jgi:hypothetical protein
MMPLVQVHLLLLTFPQHVAAQEHLDTEVDIRTAKPVGSDQSTSCTVKPVVSTTSWA